MKKIKKIRVLIRYFTIGLLLTQFQVAGANTCFQRAPEIAEAETRLWRSYYQGEGVGSAFKQTLAIRYSGVKFSPDITTSFLTATERFKAIPRAANSAVYQKQIIPLLVQFYSMLKKETNAGFDPAQVSETYMRWLIAKRKHEFTTNQQLISPLEEHYILLGSDKKHAAKMAYLYSAAANYIKFVMASSGKMTENDWKVVSSILTNALKELYQGSDQNNCIG